MRAGTADQSKAATRPCRAPSRSIDGSRGGRRLGDVHPRFATGGRTAVRVAATLAASSGSDDHKTVIRRAERNTKRPRHGERAA